MVFMKLTKEFYIVSLIMLTEVLGWSLILPFLPHYAEKLGATPFITGLILAVFSLCQFISAPIIGKLSDKFGRRPLLLISQFSTLLGFLLLGFANNLFIILLSRIVDGLFGSNMTLSRAYLTDVTKKKNRAKMFNYLDVVMGIGLFIGPAIGGFFSNVSYSIPPLIAAGLCLITIILTFFKLKETREFSEDEIVKFEPNDFFPLKDFFKAIKKPELRSFLFEFFFFITAFNIMVSSLAIFVNVQLGFGPEDVALLLILIGLFKFFFQTLALPKLLDKFTENVLAIIGLVVNIVAMFSILWITTRTRLYAVVLLFSVGSGLTQPMIINNICTESGKRERGRSMGVVNSFTSITQIIGPAIGGFMISTFYPGSVGIIGGLLLIISLYYESLEFIREGQIFKRVEKLKFKNE